ncbi:hypothetical protein GQ43DRAFT_32672 [Delitschia confertaspora ATCC 74209]|uniref:Uncharacterized protein n=1 Tax=Delitschia confertaspora ATCC 74209 TaxID=1513339 RepID=A0A9P4JLZ3_9PLEO|nr:hypothetical protein GQ43DRAFT_32672 [Delitschia confertaspora ATCC 74209]
MQFLTVASAALFVAGAAAKTDVTSFQGSFDAAQPYVKIWNKCGHKVYAWSVIKGENCPGGQAIEIEDGSFYAENFRDMDSDGTGVSIKISGEAHCDAQNLTQVEYCRTPTGPYKGNYIDMSYVNCQSGNCPSRKEGFYYKSGNQPDGMGGMKFKQDSFNNCPIFSCSSAEECAKYAYVKYNDDFATRFCDLEANWEVYLCDPKGPDGGNTYKPAPSSSSKESAPSSTAAASSSTKEVELPSVSIPIKDIKAAAVTPAPVPEEPKIKYETVVVTATAYQVVEEQYKHKRHAHGHRHQRFHA